MVLPAGSTLPPLPYAVGVVLAVALVAWALREESVAITDRTVLALSPWMVTGATLYVLHQLAVVPPVLSPLVGSPTVYATTFVVAGVTWLLALRTERPLWYLGVVGVATVLVPTGVAVASGAAAGTLAPTVPLLGVVVAAVLAAVTWVAYVRVRPADAAAVGIAGMVAVFGHALDGVSTAVGIDLLGFNEQTPLSRIVLDVAGALPTASAIGVGWLFVLVKLVLVVVVLSLLAGYVRDEPTEGNALVALVAAVGLGPGAHNVLLFAVLGPAGF